MAKRRRHLSRTIGSRKLPKGAHRLPTGGYMFDDDRRANVTAGKASTIHIRGVYRDPIDVQHLARLLMDIAKEMRDQDDHPES